MNSIVNTLVLLVVFVLNEEVQTDELISDNFEFPMTRQGTLQTRIIGGQEVSPAHSYPFQVALNIWISGATYFCGGTLISSSWVLTAAHCLDDAEFVQVILGAHNLSASESSQVITSSTEFVVHDDWNYSLLQNDIALIKLSESVTLNEYINAVELTNSQSLYANETGVILGWGLTSLGTVSPVLKYVESTILTNEECAAIDPFQTVIVSTHICTSGSGIRGSCSGDSGGPLLVDGVQVGIVSFGYSSCTVGKPSVFVRLTDYADWISTNAIEDETSSNQSDTQGNGNSSERIHHSLFFIILLYTFVVLI